VENLVGKSVNSHIKQ